MTILVVEDDDDKRKKILDFLREDVSGAVLREARSMRSGLREISESTPDLVILDMAMPSFDISIDEQGGTTQAFAGRELLRHMSRRDIGTPAVVVTQFETFGEDAELMSLHQLDQQLRSEHPSYLGTVYYNSASEDWKDDLRRILRQIIGC